MTAIFKPADVLVRQMMRRVRKTEACWLFTGCLNSSGYGCVSAGRRGSTVLAHRLAVIARDGFIPDGMTVDHLCRERTCVNPDHLDVVPLRVNVLRSARNTSVTCPAGHPHDYRMRNGRLAKFCRECENEARRKRNGVTSSDYYARRRGELPKSA